MVSLYTGDHTVTADHDADLSVTSHNPLKVTPEMRGDTID